MTSAIRMARQREARKASGKVELRLWVSPQTKSHLAAIGQESGGISLAGALTLLVWVNRQAERMRGEEG